jgi:rubrerythrin
MSIRFNADEVFAMAVKIEENGAAFYRRAQELKGAGPHSQIFENLAKMEDLHRKTFEQMRRELSSELKGEEAYDPWDEAALYLGAMADFHGGEGSRNIAAALTGKESLIEILDIGLDLEKESILYYIGLRDLVPERLGKGKIDLIIDEEKKHVVQLTQLKEQKK